VCALLQGSAVEYAAAMPWSPHRPSELERKVETLSLRLLQANAALRSKEIYCQRLEHLVSERCAMIDALHSRIDQLRSANQKLEQECEHYADMIRIMPQLDPAMSAEVGLSRCT